MPTSSKPTDPPLIDLKITNPVTYLKKWWAKIIGNEGVDIRFHIHPLTAISMIAAFGAFGFGVGRMSAFLSTTPLVKYIPQLIASPTPIAWRDTAFIGILRQSPDTKRFYLELTTGETITLQLGLNVNLTKYIGRRIFAGGNYNDNTKMLVVSEGQDLEVLPTSVNPIPTIPPTPSPSPVVEQPN